MGSVHRDPVSFADAFPVYFRLPWMITITLVFFGVLKRTTVPFANNTFLKKGYHVDLAIIHVCDLEIAHCK